MNRLSPAFTFCKFRQSSGLVGLRGNRKSAESGGSDGNPAKVCKTSYSDDQDLHENQQAIYGNSQTRPNTTYSLRSLTQRIQARKGNKKIVVLLMLGQVQSASG